MDLLKLLWKLNDTSLTKEHDMQIQLTEISDFTFYLLSLSKVNHCLNLGTFSDDANIPTVSPTTTSTNMADLVLSGYCILALRF